MTEQYEGYIEHPFFGSQRIEIFLQIDWASGTGEWYSSTLYKAETITGTRVGDQVTVSDGCLELKGFIDREGSLGRMPLRAKPSMGRMRLWGEMSLLVDVNQILDVYPL